MEQKTKEHFLTGLATVIKKDPTTSIRKRDNELKVHEKTVRRAIKQVLNQTLIPLITLYGVL